MHILFYILIPVNNIPTKNDHIKALCYKLRMFSNTINESKKVLYDNEKVVGSYLKKESSLNKKHYSLAYHAVKWEYVVRHCVHRIV